MNNERKLGLAETSEKVAYVSGGVLFLLGAPGIGIALALTGIGLHQLQNKEK